jgi:hypothetical protein
MRITINQNQLENMECLTNWVDCQQVTQNVHVVLHLGKSEMKKKKNVLFTCKLILNLRKKLVKCNKRSTDLYCADSWVLRKADQKFLEIS